MITHLAPSTYLGPARVAATQGNRVQLAFPDQEVWATLALAFPYEPVAGDSVLAIGQDDQWYVIGVLSGTGPTTLVAPGDLKLVAPRGKIQITATEGVEITAPTVRTVAQRLETVAQTAIEKFTDATRWVTRLLHVSAGESQSVTEGTHRTKAKRIVGQAEGEVKFNGDKILLG
jgi:hypothetical protein